MDRLIDAQTAEFDAAARVALMRELQARLNEAAPAVWILSFVNTMGLSDRWEWERRHSNTIFFDMIRAR